MGLMESLLGQEGVNLTGGGVVYDPTKDNWETRFDSEGNPYQARVGTPLHPGHTRANQPMFNLPTVETPTEPSLLNYGDNYYSDTPFVPQDVSPTQQIEVNPTQEHLVGTNTDIQTQHGRDIYQTPTGENVSEISVTVPVNGKWVNAPSIHNGVQLSEDQVVQGIKSGVIAPTSVHDDVQEAVSVAQSRSNNIQTDPRTPLIKGHRKASSFNIPTSESTSGLLDTPIPQTAFPRGGEESLAQDTSGAIAHWLPEQTNFDDARNLMSGYQGGERIAQRDTGTFQDLTPKADPSQAMQMLAMFKKEGKALTDLQFEKAMGSLGMSDVLEDHRSTINTVNKHYQDSVYGNTDDFGNPLDTDDFGNAHYDQRVDNYANSRNNMSGINDVERVANVAPQTTKPSWLEKNQNITQQSQDFVKNLPSNIADGATDLYEGAKDLYNDFNKDEPVDNRTWAEKRADDTKYYKDLATDTGSTIVDTATDAWEGISDAYKKYGVPADKWVTGKMIDAYDKGLPDTVTDTYNTLSKGTEDIVRAVPGAYSRGVGNMVKLGKTLGNVALGEERFDETDGGIITPRKPDYNYPMLGEGAEVMGSYVGGMGAGIKLASKAPNLVKYFSAIGGGTTTTDPTEGNLSTWIQDTDYRNAVTEFLNSETSEEANSLEKLKAYGKNFLEEGLLGGPVDATVVAWQSIKNNPELKQKILEEIGNLAQDFETQAGKIPGVETEQTLRKEMVAPGVDARTEIDTLGFYSEAENVLNKLKQETNHPDHIRQFMQKNGVTVDEMKETGLFDYLQTAKANDKRVTKTGLLAHMDSNKTQLDETQYVGMGEQQAYDAMEEVNSQLELDDPNDIDFDNLEQYNALVTPLNIKRLDNEYLDSDVEEFMGDMFDNADYTNDNMKDIVLSMNKTNTGEYPVPAGMFDANNDINNMPDWYKGINNAIEEGDASLLPENLQDDFREAVDALVTQQYNDNPYYEWVVGLDGSVWNDFIATGNEDIGIMIKGPDGQYLNDEPVYSINEANIQIREAAAEYGLYTDGMYGETKFSDYTQHGLDIDTYREIPITSKPLAGGDWHGGHFDEDNVVGHLRVSDRTDADGKKVLFIEEMQSDWHQQGRKGVYETKENQKMYDDLTKESETLKKEYEEEMSYGKAEHIRNRISDIEKEKLSLLGVPDAPLKNDKWQEMAFKRAVKIASDEGYDRVAWTNSQQQVDLYSDRYRELYENTYDKKLPGIANKLAKKHGSQTGKVKINFPHTKGGIFQNRDSVNYIDITPELKANVKKGQSMYGATSIAKPKKADDGVLGQTPVKNNAKVAIPAGGLLAPGEEKKTEELKGGLVDNIKTWKPSNDLLEFVKTMENDPLRVGNAKVKEYNDIGHKAKGYGTKSGLLAQDTEKEAARVLTDKLIDANKDVERLVKADLNEGERAALVSLIYNVGKGAFGKSKALKALNKGDRKTFLKEAFDPKIGFVKANGKIIKGLVSRRAKERDIFVNGWKF